MTLSSSYWHLSNHQIFSQLTPLELSNLSVQVGLIRCKKYQRVKLLSDGIPRIYFLKEGQLEVVRNSGTEENVVDIIHKEDIFGEFNTHFTIERDNEYANVLSEEAIICTFTKENFENVLNANPEICLRYSKIVGDRFIRLQQKYTSLIFNDARTRLYNFLKEFTLLYGSRTANEMLGKNILTHQDIADLIACDNQTVGILLKELKTGNKIDYSRDEIKLFDIY